MDTASPRLPACPRTGSVLPGRARVAHLNRGPRAAASALIVATAIGIAGTTGVGAVLAVDPQPSVPLTGMVVDKEGTALAGLHLVISEEGSPDGALAGFQATTAKDGTFTVQLYPWGTAAAPADVTIATPAHEQVSIDGEPCSRTYAVTLSDRRQIALADAAHPPKAIDVVAATKLLGEVCAATGSPAPDSGSGNGSAHSPRPRVTPPATDRLRRPTGAEERLGPALVVGFLA